MSQVSGLGPQVSVGLSNYTNARTCAGRLEYKYCSTKYSYTVVK
jgi:hypothetical protein